MPWVLPLGAGSAVTLLCLAILLAVMVYWRWVKEPKKSNWVGPRLKKHRCFTARWESGTVWCR